MAREEATLPRPEPTPEVIARYGRQFPSRPTFITETMAKGHARRKHAHGKPFPGLTTATPMPVAIPAPVPRAQPKIIDIGVAPEANPIQIEVPIAKLPVLPPLPLLEEKREIVIVADEPKAIEVEPVTVAAPLPTPEPTEFREVIEIPEVIDIGEPTIDMGRQIDLREDYIEPEMKLAESEPLPARGPSRIFLYSAAIAHELGSLPDYHEHPSPESESLIEAPAPVQGWKSGMIRALPVAAGYLPISIAFGVLAGISNIPFFATLLMSVIVYAGSSQIIAVGLIAAGASPFTIIATTFIVNLRHLLMSASLSKRFSGWSLKDRILMTSLMTDETFALIAADSEKEAPLRAHVHSLNITAWSIWIAGSIIGFSACTAITDPKFMGLDFALSCMFIALLVGQIKTPSHRGLAALSGVSALLFVALGLGHGAVILAALVGAIALTLREREIKREMLRDALNEGGIV